MGHPLSNWKTIDDSAASGGYLSFYYSDDMSSLPVRWVTKPGDNKSDPNLETFTYGLFSTCSPAMRSGVVAREFCHVFFITARNNTRVLTGYYHVKWYTQGPLGIRDFCLAADRGHFLKRPIPLSDIDARCGTNISGRFRGLRLLSESDCKQILRLMKSFPDATQSYLQEIDRLERFNLRHGGHRYIGWKQDIPFSWDYAKKYLQVTTTTATKTVANSSPSGEWACLVCSKTTKNKALLKRCPLCGSLGSLRPNSQQ